MDYNSLNAEQVGFIETTNNGPLSDSYIRLQMMGGEFCGNATRSLAALMVHNQYPTGIEKTDDGYKVKLYTSGMGEDIITCIVRPTDKEHAYYSQVEMPHPLGVGEQDFNYDNQEIDTIRVDFPGMTHFIVDSRKLKDKTEFYNIVKESMEKENDYDAFGIMYYDFENKFLEPLVYVRPTDSLFWERSCGSGTSALGAALAYMAKEDVHENVEQPGGHLEVKVKYNNKVEQILLNGLTEIVSEGIVNL